MRKLSDVAPKEVGSHLARRLMSVSRDFFSSSSLFRILFSPLELREARCVEHDIADKCVQKDVARANTKVSCRRTGSLLSVSGPFKYNRASQWFDVSCLNVSRCLFH